MAFPAPENKNRQLKDLSQADFACTWKISSVGKDQFNNWEFFVLKLGLLFVFVVISSSCFHLECTKKSIFIRGLLILIFSFINSEGLLCWYEKQSITWLLVDMKFLFSWSTRHLTRSLRSLVSCRVSVRRVIPYLRTPCIILYLLWFWAKSSPFDCLNTPKSWI